MTVDECARSTNNDTAGGNEDECGITTSLLKASSQRQASTFGGVLPPKTTPWRWVVLGLFVLSIIIASGMCISYVDIAADMEHAFDKPKSLITLLTSISAFAAAGSTLLSPFVIERYGLRKSVGLGCGLAVVAACLRLGGSNPDHSSSFALILLGQATVGFSIPFSYNCATKLTAHWFPPREHVLATTMGCASMSIGYASGFLVPPYVVNGDIKHRLVYLHVGQAGIMATMMVLTMLAMGRKAPYEDVQGPRPAAIDSSADDCNKSSHNSLTQGGGTGQREAVGEGSYGTLSNENQSIQSGGHCSNNSDDHSHHRLRTTSSVGSAVPLSVRILTYAKLLRDPPFLVVLLAFGGRISTSGALLQVFGFLAKSAGYTPKQIALVLSIPLFISVGTSLIIARIIDYFGHRKLFFTLLTSGVGTCLLSLRWVITVPDHVFGACALMTGFTVCGLPTFGIALQFAAEHTFPLDQAYSMSMVSASESVLLAAFTQFFQHLLDTGARDVVFYIASGWALLVWNHLKKHSSCPR